MEELNNKIDEVVRRHFGDNFNFRAGQREAVLEICETYFNGTAETIILDAPTGTGKSIIAMVASLVLSSYSKEGYLIASDIALQEQYEKDINNFGFHWGSIKGVDNYSCDANGEKFSLGECRIRNLSMSQTSSLTCFSNCAYYYNRSKAINSKVSLLNYSYWLVQRNYVERRLAEEGLEAPFKKRDFAFFDEAHKVDEIVQNYFSPRVDKDLTERMMELQTFLRREGYTDPKLIEGEISAEVRKAFTSDSKEELFFSLETIEHFLLRLVRIGKELKENLKKSYPVDRGIQIPKKYRRPLFLVDYVKDVHCKIEDYTELLILSGIHNLVKIPNGELSTSFQCLDEAHLLLWHFHEKAPFKVMMSATFGNHRNYARVAALKSAKVIKLKNNFDYSRSPIYYSKLYRLNYKEREKNLPPVITMLDRILDRHVGERGIIHTGSYYFSDEILKRTRHKSRIINYDGSKEKREALQRFHDSSDGIMIGPSLLEGLDLHEDKSRFQVFFKVPFPSLSDPMVKEKLKLGNEWYDWKTVLNITQGVGRSIRNREDWAVTYFLDACFYDLLKRKNNFPDDFLARIVETKKKNNGENSEPEKSSVRLSDSSKSD
jgi:ATP-dependent DNA helicase DinG